MILSDIDWASTPLLKPPVLYLPLGGGYGTRDLSPYGNHGTPVGNLHAVASPTGGGYEFDGVDDILIVANDASLHITDNMTIIAWVNADNYADSYSTVVKKDHHIIIREQLDSIWMIWWTGDEVYRCTAPRPATHKWWHVAGVIENNSPAKIYIDGVDSGDEATYMFDKSRDLTTDLCVGNSPELTEDWDGTIDEVMVFPFALTAAQIRWLYSVRSVLWWAEQTRTRAWRYAALAGAPIPVFMHHYQQQRIA